MTSKPPYPGIRVTTTGNTLVAKYTEARLADAGIFYPITPSTEMGELFQQSYADGDLNVFGRSKLALETEGEHAAQGGAIACSVTGKRVVNFTSGQGIVYGLEQYYHAPGKLSTMVVEVAARALTKHALNVHCGHDDFYAAMDTGWIMLMARDAQQAADQALIIRRVTEASLTPGMNIQDGFLTSHIERTYVRHESELIREFLGAPDDIIDCPTEAQRELFGPTRRRVPQAIDLKNPAVLGPVQNQEHYMNGVIARRDNFAEPISGMLQDAYDRFAELTGRYYGPIREYGTEGADTVFVSLGSAAENIEAVSDYLQETRGERLGSVHINIIRPFPEAAIVNALRGRKNVVVLERTDEPLSSDNPLMRDVRTALSKALGRHMGGVDDGRPRVSPDEMPRLFAATYGLGSRDFRPEGILGAYEFVDGKRNRKDGATAADGTSYFTIGIDHPYAVESDEAPSCLPDGAIAIRFHSIGGWGMITTGKNLGAIIGAFGQDLSERRARETGSAELEDVLNISANPKYGSEKKGAPTSYFLAVAPERIRVNCDLKHVDVVLCCDPKAFTHTDPIAGLKPGGALVWESDQSPAEAWKRIPPNKRRELLDKDIQVFILPGFEIANTLAHRKDLQMRMQGNAFLGAFFAVSSFLQDYGISTERFREVVLKQYQTKFGRFGPNVVDANMQVMQAGFDRVQTVPTGAVDAPDLSGMRGNPIAPRCSDGGGDCAPSGDSQRRNVFSLDYFDSEFRAGLGYHQPASALAAVGVVASAAGATASKYVARRETPEYIAENCTQCMDCISVCPDTALPNTAQDISAVLNAAIEGYVHDASDRASLLAAVPTLETSARAAMNAAVAAKEPRPFHAIVNADLQGVQGVSEASKTGLVDILSRMPLSYFKTKAIFGTAEKKNPGSGGLFSIFVSDLCKGCAACVTACGDHMALRMVPDSEAINESVVTGMNFFDTLKNTEQKYLGRYDNQRPQDAKVGVLKNHLMVRDNYDALVSGDGACAGCGEKTVLRALATVTEAYMRPLFHAKADRLVALADRILADGPGRMARLAEQHPEQHALMRRSVAHAIMGLGGETDADTDARLVAHGELKDATICDALAAVMRQDAHNHRDIQANDGRLANGMSVMAMAAHTGCNTVYGSTPPNNPHPYPWMNSLFQDGATIGWTMAESMNVDHGRRSVVPERLATALLERDEDVITEADYFDYTHFSDALMTDDEINEMPRVWVIGGDGGMGDIGFQNVSKVVLQNRPNVQMLMLDTQVYSNTGGQNSDSTPMPGGGDMNGIGMATQGKMSEKKSVAETFTAGHGSPYVGQVSMANPTKLYRSMIEGLAYRGTAFFQSFTTCQPEHGVADDMSTEQALAIRDARGMPEFVFNPAKGETYGEALDLKGNPNVDSDWATRRNKATKEPYRYMIPHWASTEARFRRHFKPMDPTKLGSAIHLENMLLCISQDDVVNRRFLRRDHRSHVPDFDVYVELERPAGMVPTALSRQMVLFCVERRKAWRMLQSKAGIENLEYQAQRTLLAKMDSGELTRADILERGSDLLQDEIIRLKAN